MTKTLDLNRPYVHLGTVKIGQADYIEQDGVVLAWSESNIQYEECWWIGLELDKLEPHRRQHVDALLRRQPLPIENGRPVAWPTRQVIHFNSGGKDRRPMNILEAMLYVEHGLKGTGYYWLLRQIDPQENKLVRGGDTGLELWPEGHTHYANISRVSNDTRYPRTATSAVEALIASFEAWEKDQQQ